MAALTTPPRRARAIGALLLALAVTACGSRGRPNPGTPAPGSGRFNLVRADFAEQLGQLTHETRAPWVWTDITADGGRLYGFQRAERADGSTLPPVAADLYVDPLVARIWLAALERLELRRGPGARPASLSADPGPTADESSPLWLGAPLQPLVPWAQVIEGGRRARLGLSTEDGRPVFQLRLPANAFDDFEAGLERALAAHDQRRAAAAAAAAEAPAPESTPKPGDEPPASEPPKSESPETESPETEQPATGSPASESPEAGRPATESPVPARPALAGG